LCLGGFSVIIILGGESVHSSRTANNEEDPAEAGKQSKFMKVFLRNTQTGWYYQEPSKWAPAQEAAQNLAQVARAVELIFAAHLDNVEILLCYDDPRYDLVLPVPPSPSRYDPMRHRHPSRDGLAPDKGKSAIPRKEDTLM
jgi:hypothetical protein